MAKLTHSFEFENLENALELKAEDRLLLETAAKATPQAYAPYSRFHVAAAARLVTGEVVVATNQENASYPVGICAERTLLGTLSSLYPGIQIDTIAITYLNHATGHSDKPASPCGLCRQSLLEYQQRTAHPIKLILAGKTGNVLVINNVNHLLPFGFGPDDLTT